jgi:serine/threonine-protein kinase
MMGVVYEAHDPDLGRRVALKTIRLAFEVSPAQRASFEKRFLAEARAAAGLSHPGIVVVHDVGRDEATGTLFIALEYLEGRTLAEELGPGAPLDWRRALGMAGQIAEALHHAHAQDIVHRDLKPANIMLLSSGQLKIMDFGIAKLPASDLTAAGQLFGTPSYMSPEQAGGTTVDARSDIFSLGCVLYELLTATRAFGGPTLPAILTRVMKEDPPPPSRVVPGIPAGVDEVVARALAKSPTDRYPNGHALAEDAAEVQQGRPPRHAPSLGEATRVSVAPASSGPPAAPAAAPQGAVDDGRRRAIAIGIGAAALLAAGFLAALVVPWRGQPALLPLPVLAPVVPSGQLEIVVQHSLRSGLVTVWVDDEQVLEETLEGRVTRKVLNLRQYKGTTSQSLAVAPGERVIRVEVQGDSFSASRRIRGTFESGVTRRLVVEAGGLLKKDLTLTWGS